MNSIEREIFDFAESGNWELLAESIRKNKSHVNIRDPATDSTPLHVAAFHGHRDCVKLLIKAQADVKARDGQRASPLALAASQGHATTMATLITHNADLNAKDSQGWTALHRAAAEGKSSCLEMLIYEGADISIAGTDGVTALHLASAFGHRECMDLLIVACENDPERVRQVFQTGEGKNSGSSTSRKTGVAAVASPRTKRSDSLGLISNNVESSSPRVGGKKKSDEVVVFQTNSPRTGANNNSSGIGANEMKVLQRDLALDIIRMNTPRTSTSEKDGGAGNTPRSKIDNNEVAGGGDSSNASPRLSLPSTPGAAGTSGDGARTRLFKLPSAATIAARGKQSVEDIQVVDNGAGVGFPPQRQSPRSPATVGREGSGSPLSFQNGGIGRSMSRSSSLIAFAAARAAANASGGGVGGDSSSSRHRRGLGVDINDDGFQSDQGESCSSGDDDDDDDDEKKKKRQAAKPVRRSEMDNVWISGCESEHGANDSPGRNSGNNSPSILRSPFRSNNAVVPAPPPPAAEFCPSPPPVIKQQQQQQQFAESNTSTPASQSLLHPNVAPPTTGAPSGRRRVKPIIPEKSLPTSNDASSSSSSTPATVVSAPSGHYAEDSDPTDETVIAGSKPEKTSSSSSAPAAAPTTTTTTSRRRSAPPNTSGQAIAPSTITPASEPASLRTKPSPPASAISSPPRASSESPGIRTVVRLEAENVGELKTKLRALVRGCKQKGVQVAEARSNANGTKCVVTLIIPTSNIPNLSPRRGKPSPPSLTPMQEEDEMSAGSAGGGNNNNNHLESNNDIPLPPPSKPIAANGHHHHHHSNNNNSSSPPSLSSSASSSMSQLMMRIMSKANNTSHDDDDDTATSTSMFLTPRSMFVDSEEDFTAASRTPPYLTWSEISDDEDEPSML